MELEERLSDAAFRGDVVALADLLAQYPNILDKNYLNCEDKNVLHVAAMLGNEEFFQAVLHARSSFCHEMCLARDRNGKNPIHLAASHGKLNILILIKDHDWLVQAAMEKTDNGGTILHLCVKHNQLDALRVLLHIFTDPDFQIARNEDGMTLLHLAFYYNQNQRRQEMIIYILQNVAKIVNLKNANSKTALDLFLRDSEIRMDSVTLSRKKRMKDHLILENAQKGENTSNPSETGFEKRRDAIMVVASLIATMAFQAMISPPGGTWQDDSNSHRVGESIMAQTHPNYYKHLIRANAVAFVSSLSIIILLVRGMTSIRPSHFFALSSIIMWLSVAAIAVVYSISFVAVVPESVRGSNLSASSHIAIIPIMVWSLIATAIVVGRCKNSRRKSISLTLPLHSPAY